jgi:hypothetical protein
VSTGNRLHSAVVRAALSWAKKIEESLASSELELTDLEIYEAALLDRCAELQAHFDKQQKERES